MKHYTPTTTRPIDVGYLKVPQSLHQNGDSTSRSTAHHELEFIAGGESILVIGVEGPSFAPGKVKRGISGPLRSDEDRGDEPNDWRTSCETLDTDKRTGARPKRERRWDLEDNPGGSDRTVVAKAKVVC